MASNKKHVIAAVAVLFTGMFLTVNTCFSMTIGDSVKFYDRGKREYRRGDYDDAIEYFKKSINQCPESAITPVAMYFLGKSYQEDGNKKMASSTYDQLIGKYKTGKWVDWAKQQRKTL